MQWHNYTYLIAFGKPAGHREVEARERSRREKKEEKKKKKGRQKQIRKTEAACVETAGCNMTTYWSYTKLVPAPAK